MTAKAWLVKKRNCRVAPYTAPPTSESGTTIEAEAYAVHEIMTNIYIKLSRYSILLKEGTAQSIDLSTNSSWILEVEDT